MTFPRKHRGCIPVIFWPCQSGSRWQINSKHLRLDVLKKNQVINFPLCLSSQSTDGKFKLHLIHLAEDWTAWSYILVHNIGFHFSSLPAALQIWIKSPCSLVSCCFGLCHKHGLWWRVLSQITPTERLPLSFGYTLTMKSQKLSRNSAHRVVKSYFKWCHWS